MILLDSDHLTVLKYLDSDRCRGLQTRLADSKDVWIGTSIINVEEQMRGWLAAIARERQVERQVAAYHELFQLFDYFNRFSIALFDAASAERFRDLRSIRIGTMDLKIAAVGKIRCQDPFY